MPSVPSDNSKVDVTVIVPVYNSAQYLPGCLESLLAETSDTFEVLLVNDGSTDESPAICDAYAMKDQRVRVLHKQNGGMCQARNVGMQHARGEYITFADNDDKILSGFVTQNYALAKKYDADCVRFGRRLVQFGPNGKRQLSSDACPAEEKCFTQDDIRNSLSAVRFGTDGVWAGLYRRDFLNKYSIEFDESFRSGQEDTLFNDMVLRFAESYAWNPNIYYEWYKRAFHSTSFKITANRLDSLKKTLEYEYETMQQFGILDSNPAECSSRFFDLVKDCLLVPIYSKGTNRKASMDNFKACYGLLEPYSEAMAYSCAQKKNDIAKNLLMARRFNLLYLYCRVGISFKNVLRSV